MVLTDSRTCTLVTVCLDNAQAMQQALPLILSFAAVGSPPNIYFEASRSSSVPLLQSLNEHLEQLLEFGVTTIFADEGAALFLKQHWRSSSSVTCDAAKVRALHIQAHAIYAF
ncbi:MAG: hypothetical protein AAF542_09745 [Pseudomonadota bacterium]